MKVSAVVCHNRCTLIFFLVWHKLLHSRSLTEGHSLCFSAEGCFEGQISKLKFNNTDHWTVMMTSEEPGSLLPEAFTYVRSLHPNPDEYARFANGDNNPMLKIIFDQSRTYVLKDLYTQIFSELGERTATLKFYYRKAAVYSRVSANLRVLV